MEMLLLVFHISTPMIGPTRIPPLIYMIGFLSRDHCTQYYGADFLALLPIHSDPNVHLMAAAHLGLALFGPQLYSSVIRLLHAVTPTSKYVTRAILTGPQLYSSVIRLLRAVTPTSKYARSKDREENVFLLQLRHYWI